MLIGTLFFRYNQRVIQDIFCNCCSQQKTLFVKGNMAKKVAAEKLNLRLSQKCDNLNEVTPNHNEVITSVAQSSPESVSIKSMIRLIRGQQVMLDSDLAFLYGVETRRLNEQP